IFQLATPPWEPWEVRYPGGQARVEERGPDGIRVTAHGPGGVVTLPVWTEHGLHIRMDGNDTTWNLTALGLMEVDVPAGSHKVELTWSVPGLDVAWWVMGVGLAALVALSWPGRWLTARRRKGAR
ncbi:MAG: hypothetical protein AB2A00_42330, partial [Myxococcota bacterium]